MRARLSSAVLLAASVVPIACSPHFTKPGATDFDWSRDSYECERDTKIAGVRGLPQQANFYERCLEARGWRK